MTDFIVVPVAEAEAPMGSGLSKDFPMGPWQGRIDTVRVRDIPTDGKGLPYAGYATDEGEVLGIQLGSNQPLEGQEAVGERKIFVDIVTRDGANDLSNVNVTTRGAAHWRLQQSAKLVMNLAIALGVAELKGTNGSQVWSVPSSFVDSLRAGEFDGMQIGFSVTHRHGKGANKGKVYPTVESFFPAA